VWYAFIWIILGLFVVRRIAAGQSIDKDFVFQFSHTYLLFKGVIMSGKDYRQRKPQVRRADAEKEKAKAVASQDQAAGPSVVVAE
jgi:hypothetical protein